MNMVTIHNREGFLIECDYFQSADFHARRLRVVTYRRDWHLLSPDTYTREGFHDGYASPVVAHAEEAGWQWRLHLAGVLDLRIPLTAFIGLPEPLPRPNGGDIRERHWLCFYRDAGHGRVEKYRQNRFKIGRGVRSLGRNRTPRNESDA